MYRRELTAKELGRVAGGVPIDRPDFDPSVVKRGWTFDDLYRCLCWVYESYHIPGEYPDRAKMMAIEVGEEFVPSNQWRKYKDYCYPDFIYCAMVMIWCPMECEM